MTAIHSQNLWKSCEDDHLDLDRFIADDMTEMLSLSPETKNGGSHGYIFCSTLQHEPWLKALRKELEGVEDSYGLQGMRENETMCLMDRLRSKRALFRCTTRWQ